MLHVLATFQQIGAFGFSVEGVRLTPEHGLRAMPLLEPSMTHWAVYWTNLITALVAFLTLLMLIVQKDSWIILAVLVSVCCVNIVLTIYDMNNHATKYRHHYILRESLGLRGASTRTHR